MTPTGSNESKFIPQSEWYVNWESVSEIILGQRQMTREILVLGAGASDFPHQLYKATVGTIVCLELEEAGLDELVRDHRKSFPRITSIVCDLSEGFNYSHPCYGLVVDRGYLDQLLCRRSHPRKAAEKYLCNLFNGMAVPGVLYLFSHSPPEDRESLLLSVGWEQDYQVKAVSKPRIDDAVAERLSSALTYDIADEWDATRPNDFTYMYILQKLVDKKAAIADE